MLNNWVPTTDPFPTSSISSKASLMSWEQVFSPLTTASLSSDKQQTNQFWPRWSHNLIFIDTVIRNPNQMRKTDEKFHFNIIKNRFHNSSLFGILANRLASCQTVPVDCSCCWFLWKQEPFIHRIYHIRSIYANITI